MVSPGSIRGDPASQSLTGSPRIEDGQYGDVDPGGLHATMPVHTEEGVVFAPDTGRDVVFFVGSDDYLLSFKQVLETRLLYRGFSKRAIRRATPPQRLVGRLELPYSSVSTFHSPFGTMASESISISFPSRTRSETSTSVLAG